MTDTDDDWCVPDISWTSCLYSMITTSIVIIFVLIIKFFLTN